MTRTIGVVTTARSDYGIYLPVLRRIRADPSLQLALYVGGMHLAPDFGSTVREIERDGFAIVERVDMLLGSDTPEAIGEAIGLGVAGFSRAFARSRPDILVVLGDRFEMFAAAAAAVPALLPVAHIHGGELTEGAMDDAFRHAITKMSHLHFASTKQHAARIAQLGEERWRITVSGAPALDNLRALSLLDRAEIEARIGFPLGEGVLLVTYHPVTLEHESTEGQVVQLLGALRDAGRPVLFTFPNADTRWATVLRLVQSFAAEYPRAKVVANLGTHLYFSVMRIADAMVGNSSSGIIEAASFELPVVNVGTRQGGRLHPRNVIDTSYDRAEIAQAIAKALSPGFRRGLRGLKNPYGSGDAAEKIVHVLRETALDGRLIRKRFCEWPMPE